MTTCDIKRLAMVHAIVARIEGMKAENEFRVQNGEGLAYGDKLFNIEAEKLNQLAIVTDDKLDILAQSEGWM